MKNIGIILMIVLLSVPVRAQIFHANDFFGPWAAIESNNSNFEIPKSWNIVVSKMRQMSNYDKLILTNSFINTYKYEYTGHDWATPKQMAKRGYGDCKDAAVAKFSLLMAAGYPTHKMKIVILYDSKHDFTHAVLDADGHILDDMKSDIETMPKYYHPIYAVNLEGWWYY